MHRPSAHEIVFLIVNAVIGFTVGTAAGRSTEFAALSIPTFFWLVLGMLIFELLMALVLKSHPYALLSFPWRIAALFASVAVCYFTLDVLGSA